MNKFEKLMKWAKKNGKQIAIVCGCAVLGGAMYALGHNDGLKFGMKEGISFMVWGCDTDPNKFCAIVYDIVDKANLSHDDLVRGHEIGREFLKELRKANC